MKKLHALYNNYANNIVKEAAQENFRFFIDLAMIVGDSRPTEDEPQIFNEAWDHLNLESRRKLQEAIQKELRDMN